MAEDFNNSGDQSDARINVNKSDDMDYWSNELKVAPQLILTAVKSVGPRIEDVKEWMRNNGISK